MARERNGLPCATCNVVFESLKAFDAHLPCKRPTHWKEPKFKDVSSKEPHSSEGNFLEPYTGDPGGARWAGETTRDRVDSHLRSRRIRALTWEAPQKPTRWERFMEWLRR